MTLYWYGMRLRPVMIGAQPKDFDRFEEPEAGSRYWNYVAYKRQLTDDEMFIYSMDYLGSKIEQHCPDML